ncbi:hypothetical protein [Aliiruegeria lutimaris]|uniref:Heat induced stress protein YflT n=1 Tax=Aliiruegeria lutimaris TaxID=571298 RepID=A0A1G9IST6_9RHOB|nr:hypothetical protein [Aliiruegeria lutimaris]SDL28135.1 hypothetical protein SAMN04488026_107611 [Aliiruegeria lutimaris]
MSDSTVTNYYSVREVVAVFHDAEKLEAAAEDLVQAGFPQSRLNVIGDQDSIAKRLGHHFEPVEVMEDDPRVPQRAFAFKSDRFTAETAVFGLPLYIGAMGGALMVVASGGALATVLLAAAAGGAVGGGLGSVLARAIGKTHADQLEAHLRGGGILFWVAVGDDEEERLAIEILKRAGGDDVHAHEIERNFGEEESVFKHRNPDPFLS